MAGCHAVDMSDAPNATMPEPADSPTSVLYGIAVESFIKFARTLTDEQWLVPVPCLPGWDVRDVLSHVAGIPDDAFAGRMDGAPGEAWTASQTERNRSLGVDELLTRYAEQHVAFGEILDGIGEQRPPFDCHAHEHDIRHALDLSGNRDSFAIEAGAVLMARSFETPFPITVEFDDGRSFTSGDASDGNGAAVSGLSTFEVYRSRLGRRARSQVENYAWTGDADLVAAAIDAWFNFGPAEHPVNEN